MNLQYSDTTLLIVDIQESNALEICQNDHDHDHDCSICAFKFFALLFGDDDAILVCEKCQERIKKVKKR